MNGWRFFLKRQPVQKIHPKLNCLISDARKPRTKLKHNLWKSFAVIDHNSFIDWVHQEDGQAAKKLLLLLLLLGLVFQDVAVNCICKISSLPVALDVFDLKTVHKQSSNENIS